MKQNNIKHQQIIGSTMGNRKNLSELCSLIEEGKIKTYDMMKLRGGADVFEKGACTTQEMTDAVIAKL